METVSVHCNTTLHVVNLADVLIVCERYALLPNDKRQMIAGELDRSVREIERKISVSLFVLNALKTAEYL